MKTEYFAHRAGRLINSFGEGTDDFDACSPILAESYEAAEAEARKLWSDESVEVTTKEDAGAVSYEVRFNKSKFACETLEEAETQARDLIQADQPFEARIIELDADGEFVRTMKTLGPQHA